MTNRPRRRTSLTCMLAGVALATLPAGCREDPAARFKPKNVNTANVISVIRALDPARFDQLNYHEKDHFLTVVTKAHGMAELIAPGSVKLVVPRWPQYTEDLFRLHDRDKVLAFLEGQVRQRLDGAAEKMKTLDQTGRNREKRLIYRMLTQYFQILYVKQYGQLVREKFAEIGRVANAPYKKMDAELVGPLEGGAAQEYLQAALEGDTAKMQEARARIDHLITLVKEKKVETEFPFPARAPVGLGAME